MSDINVGDQAIFGKFATEYKGNILKQVFNGIVSPGIQQRDVAPFVDGATIKVPSCKVAVKDKGGFTGLILATNESEITIIPDAGDDFIIARFEYVEQKNNFLDIISVDSTELRSTDIILASISTSPLEITNIPDINRFDDNEKWMDDHLSILAPVEDFTNTPPATVEGTRILVSNSGTGVFFNHNFELAVVEDLVWRFYEITRQSLVLNLDNNTEPRFLIGDTATGYITLGNKIYHDDTLNKSVDSTTADFSHLSGTAYFELLLKSNFISLVEYISNTPPVAAEDNKMYLCSDTPTGDWAGHPFEVAIDAAGGWVFYNSDKHTLILSKEETEEKDDWKFYIFKSDPDGYVHVYFEKPTMDNIIQGDSFKKITTEEYDDVITPIKNNLTVFNAVDYENSNTVYNILNDPPVAAEDNKRYLINTAPTGDWLGHALEVAIDAVGGWVFKSINDASIIIVKSGSEVVTNWKRYYVKSSTLQIREIPLSQAQETNLSVLSGGPLSNADSLHKHDQYDVQESTESNTVDTIDSQTFCINKDVELIVSSVRVLEHPIYILLFDYDSGYLYQYDKNLELINDINVGTTNLSDKYGWYLNYIVLFKQPDDSDTYLYLINLDTGVVDYSLNFTINAELKNVKFSDAIVINNRVYFQLAGERQYEVTGDKYFAVYVYGAYLDLTTVTLISALLKESDPGFRTGDITYQTDSKLYLYNSYNDFIFCCIMRDTDDIVGVGGKQFREHLKLYNFKTDLDLIILDEYVNDSPGLINNIHDIADPITDVDHQLEVLTHKIKDVLYQYIYLRYRLNTVYFYGVWGFKLDFPLMEGAVTILSESESPWEDLPPAFFTNWYYGIENKSTAMHIDIASANKYAWGDFSDIGELNSLLTAIKANIISCTVVDNKIYVLLNDTGNDKILLWVLNSGGALLTIKEICDGALSVITNGYTKVLNYDNLTLQLLFQNKESGRLYQTLLINDKGILPTTGGGSGTKSTVYDFHKTEITSGTGVSIASFNQVNINEITINKLIITVKANISRPSMPNRQLHIMKTIILTDDMADFEGDIYSQQSFTVVNGVNLIDIDIFCILNFGAFTLDVQIMDGVLADTGAPQFSDYTIESGELHVYYN